MLKIEYYLFRYETDKKFEVKNFSSFLHKVTTVNVNAKINN